MKACCFRAKEIYFWG